MSPDRPSPARTRFAEPVAAPSENAPATENAPAATRAPVEANPVEPVAEAVVDSPAVSDPATAEAPAPAEPVASDDPVPAVDGKRPGGALVAILVGMVVVMALLAGFLTYTVFDTRGAAPVEASRKAALDAGRSAARLAFSYDYRHLDKDFKAGRATTTGKFQKEYDKTTSKLVADVAPRYKAVVVADVSEASVVSASDSQVELLVFVNQQSSSSLSANPKITQSRLEMTMKNVNGDWLVEDIKAL